ncbi:TlpA disulfide reductase family protein [Luteimonas mephitis]|uniref:TlpA disulfide reductase family protein n=1 Tax=Luteimonas mephitis TaxID=83615 RepID=UPI00047AB4B4|nr:TlpA disulfide reductase family protein [Luteimonas mephitis]
MTGIAGFPIRAIAVALATLIAWGVARVLARRLPDVPMKSAGTLIVDALFVGLLVARVAYIILWWREYVAAPLAIIQIGDGGFIWWLGLAAGVAFIFWRTTAVTALRRPVLAGVAAGVVTWAAAGGALWWMQQSAPPLPSIALTSLDGSPTDLSDYAGHPVVVNLWATWCPPCRREMPVLERAQKAYPGVNFVLVNQGEDVATIQRFLTDESLDLRNILRDPHSRTMAETGARALPTTFYFDADGRLVDTHLGGVTSASLADSLYQRFGALPLPEPKE